MIEPEKLCPRCHHVAPLQLAVCTNCRHTFRTQFASRPSAQHTSLPPAHTLPPLLLTAPPQTQSPSPVPDQTAAREPRSPLPILWLTLGLSSLVMVLLASGWLVFGHALARKTESTVTHNAVSTIPTGTSLLAAGRTVTLGRKVFISDDGVLGREHVAMALKDAADLTVWQKTLKARDENASAQSTSADDDSGVPASEQSDDMAAQDRLVQQGRIVVLDTDTPADLLSVHNTVARVKISEGVNAGQVGMVSKYCLYATVAQEQPLYRLPLDDAPPIQKPDTSLYPLLPLSGH